MSERAPLSIERRATEDLGRQIRRSDVLVHPVEVGTSTVILATAAAAENLRIEYLAAHNKIGSTATLNVHLAGDGEGLVLSNRIAVVSVPVSGTVRVTDVEGFQIESGGSLRVLASIDASLSVAARLTRITQGE